MKKNRILGRRLARELKQSELQAIGGGAPPTYTLTYPPDRDNVKPGGGGVSA